jgi:hypothetical protein
LGEAHFLAFSLAAKIPKYFLRQFLLGHAALSREKLGQRERTRPGLNWLKSILLYPI